MHKKSPLGTIESVIAVTSNLVPKEDFYNGFYTK